MPKIKLTKGELKKQRDALKQYQRYLPTLQLKKQQLQVEILRQTILLAEKNRDEEAKINSAAVWAGLLAADRGLDIRGWLRPKEITVGSRNIAGVSLPVFERLNFDLPEYDLFIAPLQKSMVRHSMYPCRNFIRRNLVLSTEQASLLEKLMPEHILRLTRCLL